jgi:hypothetical protein
VIFTVAEVVAAVLSSMARTETLCSPAVEVHANVNGAAVFSPTFASFTKNSTFDTVPSASLAVAVIVTGWPAVKRLPPAGEVNPATGAWLGAGVGAGLGLTVMLTAAEVMLAFLSSVTRTVNE